MKSLITASLTGIALVTVSACSQSAQPEASQDSAGGMASETPALTESDTLPGLCDENGKRYASDEEALAAGLDPAQYGATMCPEYKMHPSWDANNDGVNDCEDDGSCDPMADYMSPRKDG